MTESAPFVRCRNHADVVESLRPCSRCGDTHCPDCLVDILGQPFCAPCKTQQLLDVQSGVDRKALRHAGFWARFGAEFLDILVFGIPAYAIFVAIFLHVSAEMQRSGTLPVGLVFAAYAPIFVFPIVYEALMLSLKDGRTIGKMALRLRVVRSDGSRVTAGQAWTRAALRVVLGCLVVVDVIPFFFTDARTTLHDMVAGTRVVQAEDGAP